VEVKIGISETPREVVINSGQTQDEVAKLIGEALAGTTAVLDLIDEKGRRHLIQAAKIAYAEIGSSTAGRVGFGV
jgi:hypothetical protein